MHMIMSRKELAHTKLDNLKKGYSAFTDSEEIATIIKKEIPFLDISIHVDQTELGYWFIPELSLNSEENTESEHRSESSYSG